MTRQNPDVSRYAYRVTWSVEDDEFVATCAEFPSLSWLAGSQAEALQGLVALVANMWPISPSMARLYPNPCPKHPECARDFEWAAPAGWIRSCESALGTSTLGVSRFTWTSCWAWTATFCC